MALTQQASGRMEEIEALKMIEGVDPEDIMRQVSGEPSTPPPPPPPQGATPPPPTPPPPPQGAPSSEAANQTAAAGILKEIFGDQFTTVEELKNNNIPEKLKEAEELRRQVQLLSEEKTELSGKLAVKPKTNFANDDVALFNEFVRTTGIKSFDVFSRLNGANIANMDYMDAIILARQLESPELVSKEPQLRKHIENQYNVDPLKVDADDLEVNKIGLAREGSQAKAKLLELKGKLTIPEPTPDTPAAVTWTPEQEAQAKTQWSAANKAMTEKLSNIPIYLPNSKEPFINFTVPKETQEAIQKTALQFAVNNRMEINDQTITAVAKSIYTDIVLGNLGQIAHSIFEKARSMTEEESLKYYHNPSPLPGERPAAGGSQLTPEEEARQRAFDAEMGRT